MPSGASAKSLPARFWRVISVFFLAVAAVAANSKPTSQIVIDLGKRDPMVRIRAILGMAAVKPNQRIATALIKTALKDDNDTVSEIAADVLAGMATEAKGSVPSVVVVLLDQKRTPAERIRAANVVWALGGEAREAVPALLKILENRQANSELRQRAAVALGRIRAGSEAVPRLIDILVNQDEDFELRQDAAGVLEGLGSDATAALRPLSVILNDKKENLKLREDAARALGAISGAAQIGFATAILTAIVTDKAEDLGLRREATVALQPLGQVARGAATSLIQILANHTEPSELRLDAIGALSRLGRDGRVPTSILLSIVKNRGEPSDLRLKSAQVLGSTVIDESVVNELTDLISDGRQIPALRAAVITSLASAGETAQVATPILLRILANSHEDPELRRRAAQAIGTIRPLQDAVPVMIEIVARQNEDAELRASMAYSLGLMGSRASAAVPTLREILVSPDAPLPLRRQAAFALLVIRRNATGVIPALLEIVRDQSADFQLRRTATSALAAIAYDSNAAIPEVITTFVSLLSDPREDPQIRASAAGALGQSGGSSTAAVQSLMVAAKNSPEALTLRQAAISALTEIARTHYVTTLPELLIQILDDKKEQKELRQQAANSLATIDSKGVVPELIRVLAQSSDEPEIEAAIVDAIGNAHGESEIASTLLARLLRDPTLDPRVRGAAARSLGRKGSAASKYIDLLIKALQDDDQSVQYSAAAGLSNLADSAYVGNTREILPALKKAKLALESRPTLAKMRAMDGVDYGTKIGQATNFLESQSKQSAREWSRRNSSWLAPVSIWSLAAIIQLLLFWFKPIALLKLYRKIGLYRYFEQIPFQALAGPLKAAGAVAILPSLVRRPRVLDAWVSQYLEAARTRFYNENTVRHTASYIPLPVKLAAGGVETLVAKPTPEALARLLHRKRAVVELVGPGGSGKTTLAIQIARWALGGIDGKNLLEHPALAILIDEETTDLVGLIQRKLKGWVDEDVERDFVLALLSNARLVLIVDRLSERSTRMREYIRTIHGSTALGPLVITTRVRTDFEGGNLVQIFPQPLNSETLLNFMTGLLSFVPGVQPFADMKSQLDLASRFASVIRLQETSVQVTPLLVKLYVDKALRLRRADAPLDTLPNSIPEMYYEFLEEVNPDDSDAPNYLPHEEMFRTVELLGRLSLENDFVPKEFLKSRARHVFKEQNRDNAGIDAIQRLVDNNVLQESPAGSEIFVRFTFDPVAEFVAAMAWAKECGSNIGRWTTLYERIETQGSHAVGFGEALRLVSQAYGDRFGWPDVKTSSESTIEHSPVSR